MFSKTYVKSRKVAKITFELPKAELPNGVKPKTVNLVGDFNGWDGAATQMKAGKRRVYRATVELEPGKKYQFRYLVNGEHWCNDWHADAYVSNGYGEDNSVVLAPSA